MISKQGGIFFDCKNIDEVQEAVDKVIDDIFDERSKYITGDIFFYKDGEIVIIRPKK